MDATLLQALLGLQEGETLERYERRVGRDWKHPKGLATYRLRNPAGEVIAVIDAWSEAEICCGYVAYDAGGHRILERECFRLPADSAEAAAACF